MCILALLTVLQVAPIKLKGLLHQGVCVLYLLMAHIVDVLDAELPILYQLRLLMLAKLLHSAFDLESLPHMH